MKLKDFGIIVSIVAGIAAIWYYLRGTPSSNLVTYPNTQASGQPASQNPATVYNIAAASPAPSPNLIYGTMPPLPATPGYQSYNYAPANILGLTPQGAASTTVASPSASGSGSGSCGCSSGGGGSQCGCGGCGGSVTNPKGRPRGGGTYQDGQGACLASNPKEQILSASPALYAKLQANIGSSSVGPNPPSANAIPAPTPTPSPVAAAAVIPWQAQGIAQGQVGQAPPTTPPVVQPFMTWAQFDSLMRINSGVVSVQ
jgi:hypothetical protein